MEQDGECSPLEALRGAGGLMATADLVIMGAAGFITVVALVGLAGDIINRRRGA